MRILLLTTILRTPDKGKIPPVESIKDSMYYGMALGFVTEGHSVTMLAVTDYKPCNDENYEFPIYFFKSNLRKIFRPDLMPFPVGYFYFLKKYRDQYDLIICGGAFTMPAIFAAFLCPQKTIIWNEAVNHFNRFFRIPSLLWYNFVVRFILRKILIIPRSVLAYSFICKYSSYVSKEYVDHGVDISKFPVSGHKEKQFIVVSQLIPRKNIASIIRIMKCFNECNSDSYKLIIIGKGNEENYLKQLTMQLGMNHLVEFKGFMSHAELASYLSQSYALLINTFQDVSMVSIPESIVVGTPVITNMVPALADFINKNKLGIAKNGWGIKELNEIIANNSYYCLQCLSFRERLSSRGCAEQIVDIFRRYKRNEKE